MSNKNLLFSLQADNRNKIDALWVPGHEGIHINEMADQAAKEEAKRKVDVQRPLERKIVLTVLREQVNSNWQRRVDIELGNHQIAEINKEVTTWKLFNIHGSRHLSRLISGHHSLNSFQSILRPNRITKSCDCGQTESVYHFLFTCQRYTRFRQKWFAKIFSVTGNPEELHHPTFKTVFGQRKDLDFPPFLRLYQS